MDDDSQIDNQYTSSDDDEFSKNGEGEPDGWAGAELDDEPIMEEPGQPEGPPLTSSPTPPPTTTPTTASDDDDEQPFLLTIPNWNHQGEKIMPQPTWSRFGYTWQLNIFPRGFHDSRIGMGLFLLLTDPNVISPTMFFEFMIIHPTDPTKNFKQASSHSFRSNEDNGWRCFQRNEDTERFLHDDGSLHLQVKILKGPSEKRHIPLGYNSRKETGLAGIKNQGATCYMNSLLQTLFLIPKFRHAVYNLPLDDIKSNDIKPSMTLALQRVFYQLQYDDTPVSTKLLTQSFGWNTMESFQQHDVQEFSRVLLDTVEEKMKGTPVTGMIAKLFQGHSQSYIECTNVDVKSNRTEEFLDLQLNVKGVPDLMSSFKQYVEIEMLVGENQYRAEGYGLQDARKGTRFLSFPPVMQLQLKRFEYNPETDTMMKIHDHFAFPEKLDLREFVPEEKDDSNPAIYHLHSVLVHSGNTYGGHYTCYVRPIPRTGLYENAPWFKFDDDVVTAATSEEAIAGNYGGSQTTRGKTGITIELSNQVRYANAYMLVYLRQNETQCRQFQNFQQDPSPDVVMNGTDTKEPEIKENTQPQQQSHHNFVHVPIPSSLLQKMQQEKVAMEEREKEERERHLYSMIQVLSESALTSSPFGMNLDVKQCINGVDTMTFPTTEVRVKKTSMIQEYGEKWEQITGIPVERQQYWRLRERNDVKGYRPVQMLSKQAFIHTIYPLLIFIRDTADDVHSMLHHTSLLSDSHTSDRYLILLKYWDIPTQSPIMLGSTIMLIQQSIADVKSVVHMKLEKLGKTKFKPIHHEDSTQEMMDTVNTAANLSITEQEVKQIQPGEDVNTETTTALTHDLELWEEQNIRLYPSNPLRSYTDDTILSTITPFNGDIYMLQHHYTCDELLSLSNIWKQNHPHQPFFTSITEYLEYQAFSITIEFKPLAYYNDPYHMKAEKPSVSLTFQTNQSYADFMTKLGAAIGHEPDRIQLQSHPDSGPLPAEPASQINTPLNHIFYKNYATYYYILHSVTHTQRGRMHRFPIHYYSWRPWKPLYTFDVWVSRKGKCSDLEHAIRLKLEELDNEINNGKRKSTINNNNNIELKQDDGKRQKLQDDNMEVPGDVTVTTPMETHAVPPTTDLTTTPMDATSTPTSTLPAPIKTDEPTSESSPSTSPSASSPGSPTEPSPFSPSGALSLTYLESNYSGIKEIPSDFTTYHLHQRTQSYVGTHPIIAMEMTYEYYQYLKEVDEKQPNLTSRAVWFYPVENTSGHGMECGFPLVITSDMSYHDVRNKLALRLHDTKVERYSIFRIDFMYRPPRIWKEDIPFLSQVGPNDIIGLMSDTQQQKHHTKKPSWTPKAASVKIHQ